MFYLLSVANSFVAANSQSVISNMMTLRRKVKMKKTFAETGGMFLLVDIQKEVTKQQMHLFINRQNNSAQVV